MSRCKSNDGANDEFMMDFIQSISRIRSPAAHSRTPQTTTNNVKLVVARPKNKTRTHPPHLIGLSVLFGFVTNANGFTVAWRNMQLAVTFSTRWKFSMNSQAWCVFRFRVCFVCVTGCTSRKALSLVAWRCTCVCLCVCMWVVCFSQRWYDNCSELLLIQNISYSDLSRCVSLSFPLAVTR